MLDALFRMRISRLSSLFSLPVSFSLSSQLSTDRSKSTSMLLPPPHSPPLHLKICSGKSSRWSSPLTRPHSAAPSAPFLRLKRRGKTHRQSVCGVDVLHWTLCCVRKTTGVNMNNQHCVCVWCFSSRISSSSSSS